jgi:thiol-disulfide isomerase/thioredoxin
LNDLDKARAIATKMQFWLSQNDALKDDRSSGYARFKGQWLNSTGKIAEAEGHKTDAIAYYTQAIATGAVDPDAAKHSRALWDELGGTEQGWNFATARPLRPKPPSPAPTGANVISRLGGWNEVGKPLPAMNLHDVAGATWTLQNFQGKRTFINVWATWCSPCQEELPHLQKLYELAKDRDDIQVVTLNIDADPGLVQPFLAANHYTFPVVMSAGPYVGSFTGPVTVPQNWLVDPVPVLLKKSLGFDIGNANWPADMLENLARTSK